MRLINVTKNDISEETKKQKQQILDKIKNMDAFLSFTPNPEVKEYSSNVQYLKQKESNPEVIKNKVESNLSGYKNFEINKINQKADSDINKLFNKVEETKKLYDDKTQKKEDYYNSAKENKTQKLASNGLGRSSIMEQGVAEVEGEKKQVLNMLQKEAQSELSNLQNQKKRLEIERDDSLANFDIQYALKVQEQIDKLTKEVQEYNDKVQKYNNQLSLENEKRARDYAKQLQKNIENNENRNKELVQFLSKYGYGNYYAHAQKQKEQLIKDFVDVLDKQSALEVMLENDDFKDVLGEDSFNKIIQQIQERKD